MRARSTLPVLALVTLAALARAQDFNVDVGTATGNPTPGPGFAAGGHAGNWTIGNTGGGVGATSSLTDVAGNPTAVTLTISGGGNFGSAANLTGASVDDLNLMSDILDLGTPSRTLTISGLAPDTYDVLTYAMAPDNASYRTDVSVAGSSDPLQTIGGTFPGTNTYVLGVTHARHRVVVAPGGTIVITAVKATFPTTNAGSVNGFQIERVANNGTPFCFGDGIDTSHTTPCPCANLGAPGHGCANSVNAAGALLDATGDASQDSIVLLGSGMPATVSCIYLQGDGIDDASFGDGVRCTGGTLIRLRTRTNVGGASAFPDSTDTVSLSQRGGVVPGSGAVRLYQTYYRNAAALFCPPETFNVTNGRIVTW